MNQQNKSMQLTTALVSAFLFGIGLEVSSMTNPQKVIGFLNITDKWDPSLMFVMVGAILVNAVIYQIIKKKSNPLFDVKFQLPTLKNLDKKLIIGSALFGIGWGVGGFCPGPAIASVLRLQPEVFIVIGSMILGMWFYKIIEPKL